MMSFYRINRWSSIARLSLFLGIALVVTLLWFGLFFGPLAKSTQTMRVHSKELSAQYQQLNQLALKKDSYIYVEDIQNINLDKALKNLAKQSGNIYISDISRSDKTALTSDDNDFSLLPDALGVSLNKGMYVEHIQLKLSASYGDFIAYLKAIRDSRYQIYFNSINFDMKSYPRAQIVLDLFAIEQ
jgi:hypothetical protein